MDALRNLFLLDVFLNPVTWTLKVEIMIAFIFPVLYRLSRLAKDNVIFNISILVGLFFLAQWAPNSVIMPYLYEFYLGLLLPLLFPVATSSRLRQFGFVIIFFSFFLLLIVPQVTINGIVKEIGMTFGAAALITMLATSPGSSQLKRNTFMNLGKYSYGFYLWHFPVLWFSYYALHTHDAAREIIGHAPMSAAVSVCILSIVIAYFMGLLSYKLVERPSINFGRKVAASI